MKYVYYQEELKKDYYETKELIRSFKKRKTLVFRLIRKGKKEYTKDVFINLYQLMNNIDSLKECLEYSRKDKDMIRVLFNEDDNFRIKYSEFEKNKFKIEIDLNKTDDELIIENVILVKKDNEIIVDKLVIEGSTRNCLNFQNAVNSFLENLD